MRCSRRVWALVAIVVVAAAACGGGSSSAPTTTARQSSTTVPPSTTTTAVEGTGLDAPAAVGQAVRLTDGQVDVLARIVGRLAPDPQATTTGGPQPAGTSSFSLLVEYENVGSSPVTPGPDIGFTPVDPTGQPVVTSAADFCTPTNPAQAFGTALAPAATVQGALCFNLAPETVVILRLTTKGTPPVVAFLALT